MVEIKISKRFFTKIFYNSSFTFSNPKRIVKKKPLKKIIHPLEIFLSPGVNIDTQVHARALAPI